MTLLLLTWVMGFLTGWFVFKRLVMKKINELNMQDHKIEELKNDIYYNFPKK